MSDPSQKSRRSPTMASVHPSAAPGGYDPNTGAPLADYFSAHAPMPAPAHELIDHDAATRVASANQLLAASGGQGAFPTNPGGWQPLGHDPSEAMTLNAAQMQGYVQQAIDMPDESTRILDPSFGAALQGGYGGPMDPNYAMGVVVDPGSAMVLSGGDPYGMPGAAGMVGLDGTPLRENPPEHVDTFSPDLVMLSHPDGFAAAQFRTLRLRIEQEPGLQVLVVASAREGDGRSVTAANLALALAEGGRVRVLLIDAALRNPRQHTLFGIRGDLGLTSVLAARSNDPTLPIDVIQISASLRLLPAGPAVASAHAALSSEAAMVLLHQLRGIFNYIIVDSAPVFGSGETLAWHGLIDRYLLVARAGVSTSEDLTACCDRLQREKILGVTFIGAKNRRK